MIKQLVGKLQKKPSFKNSSADPNFDAKLINMSQSHPATLIGSSADNPKASNGAPAQNSVGNGSNSTKLNHQGKKSSSKGAQIGSNLSSLGYDALPSFREVPNSEKQNLFIKKLNLCCVVFDFRDPGKNVKEKDIKRQTLLELVDYISSVVTKINEVAMQEIVKMVAVNLFRTFPSPNHDVKVGEVYDADEDELTTEPAWPHLQIVYEFLLRFIASPETDAKVAKRFIDHSFVLRLLDLFDSEDQREREYLKTILHRIYGKFMVHRPYIRKAINNIFFKFIFETEKHNGIAELLEILGSIINGFALPLKEEHKLFLMRALVPLHKPKSATLYHQQLSYCIIQFVEKDHKLADIVIKGLLKYWPVTNSSKEVLFLSELEEILEATRAAEFQNCMAPLFHQLGRCLNSSHFQVAERALFLWNNDHIRNLIMQNRKLIVPIILPALERNTRGHWNQAVLSLTLNVRKVFSDADPELFQDCLAKFQESEAKEKETQMKRESTWKRLEHEASLKAETDEADIISTFTTSLAITPDGNSLTTTL